MEPDGLGQLIADALDIWRGATGPADYDAIWPVLRRAGEFGPDAFELSVEMLRRPDAADRSVAADLLAVPSETDDANRFRGRTTRLLSELADSESDVDVLCSIGRALGRTWDPTALPVLATLALHADEDVRYAAACAIPACADAEPARAAEVLIALMDDPDATVRDWATFGLGTQLHIDAPAIREALLKRVDDSNLDAADEAVVGLARRRDPRTVAFVDERLRSGSVGRLVVESAEYLATAELLPALQELKSWWDLDTDLLEQAMRRCDPELQAQDNAIGERFLELVEAAPERGLSVALFCDCLEVGTMVNVVAGDDVRTFDFDALLKRADHDPGRAAHTVLNETFLTPP